ncbi:MAG: hypothetical protein NTX82_05570 [Candidatus Parcubacteria bacterium]|nr:hypothetical protein [Candidatus Parcubacteria bacterium]
MVFKPDKCRKYQYQFACRKLLAEDDWKLPELLLRYKGNFFKYIEKKILDYRI